MKNVVIVCNCFCFFLLGLKLVVLSGVSVVFLLFDILLFDLEDEYVFVI